MALTGSLYIYHEAVSPTLSSSITASYPIHLPENDPNYDKRGTTEYIWISQSYYITESITSSYVVLHHVNTHNEVHYDTWESSSFKHKELEIGYRIYSTYEDRLLANHLTGSNYFYADWSSSNDPGNFDYFYTKLKEQNGFQDLIDC